MGKSIRVPDPVYDKAHTIAEREDVSIGVIVRDWMEKADKYDETDRGGF